MMNVVEALLRYMAERSEEHSVPVVENADGRLYGNGEKFCGNDSGVIAEGACRAWEGR